MKIHHKRRKLNTILTLSKRCPKTHFISARRPSFGRLNLGPEFTLIYPVLTEIFLRETISTEDGEVVAAERPGQGLPSFLREDFLNGARAVGKALGGDANRLQKGQVKVTERLLARLEKIMVAAVFDPQVASTGN